MRSPADPPPDPLAAARAHLERIEASGDSSGALAAEVRADMQRLSEMLGDGDQYLEARHVVGLLHWHGHLAQPGPDGVIDQLAAYLMLGPCFAAGMTPLPGPLMPWLADGAVPAAAGLLERAVAAGDTGLLSDAVRLWQRIAAHSEQAPAEDRAARWSDLGVGLAARHSQAGARGDLDAAISAFRTAISLAPADDADRGTYLTNLSGALRTRYHLTGSQSDADEAVAAGELAAQDAAGGEAGRSRSLSNLAVARLARFEQGDGEGEADLGAAIAACRAALAAAGDDDEVRAAVLSNLGICLHRRFERRGVTADLNAAIDAHMLAVGATEADHPDRAKRLLNLAVALLARSSRSQEIGDLDGAIDAVHLALDALREDHPERPLALHALAMVRYARFGWTGNRADLDAGIEALRSGLERFDAAPADRGAYLATLAGLLMSRSEQVGATADLDAAITAGRRALAVMPGQHVGRPPVLSFLAAALLRRADLAGTDADTALHLADEAVRLARQAVAATPPGHQNRARHLNQLALSLDARSGLAGPAADLDEAIAVLREASAEVPGRGPERAGLLSNLSVTLRTRFERDGRRADLDEALAANNSAMRAMPRDHGRRAELLANAGMLRLAAFHSRGHRASRALAGLAYLAAARQQSAAPSVRIAAARQAADLVARRSPGRAAKLLELAVRLLPQVAPRQLVRADQQRQLAGFSGLARDAAALTLASSRGRKDRPQRASWALALLELGRGVLLSQALDTRDDLSDLSELHPELAERYRGLRDLLDVQAAGTGAGSAVPGDLEAAIADQLALPGRAVAERHFAATVAQIRKLDGFARFMLPPTLAELLAAAEGAGAVVLNVSQYRSDALIARGGAVDSLPLPGLSLAELERVLGTFRRALALHASGTVRAAEAKGAADALFAVLEWLWDVAAEPVLDALGYREPPGSDGWPVVHWIASGPLARLPVHAAGHHRDPGAACPRTVMDRVISSHAPTLRALRHARAASAARAGQLPRSLVVAAPGNVAGKGGFELPGAADGIGLLCAALPQAGLLIRPPYPDGVDPATVAGPPEPDEVLRALAGCAFAHFACHGVTDPADPSRSGLLLGGEHSEPLTVAALAPVRLGAARLAYLSACSTALSEADDLADESVHLASAFQLAGFPHVIGTLWKVEDEAATAVAVAFYERLRTEDGHLRADRAAQALHSVVRQLRDEEPEAPFLWAAYLHAGA